MLKKVGFTLAELLIALAILGVIATFTIPKVLQSQANTKYNAMAKEVAGTLSAVVEAYKLQNTLTATTTANSLTPYLNYVKILTTGTVDDIPVAGAYACSDATTLCIKLHNGGVLANNSGPISFGGTSSTNAIYFSFDPDGAVSDYKAVNFFIYTNGALKTEATIFPGTVSSDMTRNPDATKDPSWFSW